MVTGVYDADEIVGAAQGYGYMSQVVRNLNLTKYPIKLTLMERLISGNRNPIKYLDAEGLTYYYLERSRIYQPRTTTRNDNNFIIISITSQDPKLAADIANAIQSAFRPVIDSILSGLQSVWNFITKDIPNAIQQIPPIIQGIINTVANYISTGFTQLWNSVKDIIEGFINYVSTTLPVALENIGKTILNISSIVSQAFQSFINSIQEGFTIVTKFFTETLPNWIAQVPKLFESLVNEAWKVIETNIIKPITDAATQVFETIKSSINTLVDFLSKQLPSIIDSILSLIHI